MTIANLEQLSLSEKESFKAVCNHLLDQTFIVRDLIKNEETTVFNPEFRFLSLHHALVDEYLSYSGWDLLRDDLERFYYIRNQEGANKLTLNKFATEVLINLRLMYDLKQDEAGVAGDVRATVADLLDNLVAHGNLSKRPNMITVADALRIMENHTIITKLHGSFKKADGLFAILPTVQHAVSSERLRSLVKDLREQEGGPLEDAE
ncbi:MAG: DUF4194 domain-containing protein [Gordonibacter sp.]|uniref:DUF4194 domain-containing protein n=1 Tax=Gordonibacter sp. TaxID=1968902 RepID=UPI002FCA7CC9